MSHKTQQTNNRSQVSGNGDTEQQINIDQTDGLPLADDVMANGEEISESQALHDQIAELTQQLAEAKSKEARAMADYQNLMRRTQQERIALFKTAGKDFVEAILQPLEYLSVAAEQLNDKGLNMVISQLWNSLKSQGLEEIDVMGKTFDIQTMEAVDSEGDGKKVTKIVRKGYTLNGEVIQFAKVILN